ncbi:putative sodium-dependent multivitamin transporter [Lutzomyia longipalpis]|uniref:putative sodium-dependent multivitamin transporter n=1 Tax=Lutzomyia longipalpis TaxID=7200 RepID=UPI0024844BF9|nr:putative sodium-dependent multivitamin transporter [Lutzomyia longipalpis]XP_055695889.1 putative sodium-dependent multivitamin transporter [Lutzomyia longipalpis]
MASFTAWDYVVFIVMLLISAGIGVYYRFTGGKQKTTNEYLLADRSMSVWPVSFSLMASFMSAITILGVSMENYQFGTLFVIINISYGLATPIASHLYLPVFYKLQAASAYEYLEKRFGRATRLCASIAYSLQMILYMGIVLYAPALALEAVTGMSRVASVLSIGIVCTFYSTIGGMKAVLITDVFQSILMFAAVFSIIIVAAILAGGLGEIWRVAEEGNRIEFLNFNPDPTVRHTWWSLIIGGGFTYLSLYAVNQTQVQRLLTVRSLKASQAALWLNWPILSLLSFSTSFSGLAIYYYYARCDPLLQGRISSRDQLMPIFVVDTMHEYSGLPGLFVSGIFSASLSTVSAALNSLAAVTLEDYMKPLYQMIKKRPLVESKSTLPSKLMACVYGVICIGIAFGTQSLGGVLQAALTVFGVVGGPLFGLFTLGMFNTVATQRSAIFALLTGLIFSLWIGFGQPKPPVKMLEFSTEGCTDSRFNSTFYAFTPISEAHSARLAVADAVPDDSDYFWLYRLSYLWYSVLGFLVTLFVGLASAYILKWLKLEGESCIYEDETKECINTDLFSPPIAWQLKKRYAKYIQNGGIVDMSSNKIISENTKF